MFFAQSSVLSTQHSVLTSPSLVTRHSRIVSCFILLAFKRLLLKNRHVIRHKNLSRGCARGPRRLLLRLPRLLQPCHQLGLARSRPHGASASFPEPSPG